MAGIVWLASYPKSGNTWVRLFLANYRVDGDAPFEINRLALPNAARRAMFDSHIGMPSSELGADEIKRLRPEAYRSLARAADATLFLKVHDAFSQTDQGEPLFPVDVTHGVVYIMRNPCDVAVSLAHHTGTAPDDAARRLCLPGLALAGREDRQEEQLPQEVGSWSSHVTSWVDALPASSAIVRYEDLCADPVEAFTRVVVAAGLAVDPDRIARAIAHSRFEELQAQETRSGFRERLPIASAPFFRKGGVGGWKDHLSPEDVRRLIDAHGDVMRRFGYLTDAGDLVF